VHAQQTLCQCRMTSFEIDKQTVVRVGVYCNQSLNLKCIKHACQSVVNTGTYAPTNTSFIIVAMATLYPTVYACKHCVVRRSIVVQKSTGHV
jgi:hypothetical protein